MLSLKSTVSKPCSNLSAYAVIRKYHCLIFFFTTGWPPRSLTPFTTSSFANTVPNASHQFTSPYFEKAKRRFINTSSFSGLEKLFHCDAVKFNTECSMPKAAEPSASNIAINCVMLSAFCVLLLYQLLNNSKKIFCVHL